MTQAPVTPWQRVWHRLIAGVVLTIPVLLQSSALAQPFDGLGEAIGQGEYGNIKALLVSQHGELLYEDYFRGYGPNDLQVMNSVTKSVGSALIGIAHRQGRLALDQDLEYFFSDLYPMQSVLFGDKRRITVENVLQQRHGIEWDEWTLDYRDPNNPVYRMVVSGDWYQYVLGRPVAPGTIPPPMGRG